MRIKEQLNDHVTNDRMANDLIQNRAVSEAW
jgi:hypothetical protein